MVGVGRDVGRVDAGGHGVDELIGLGMDHRQGVGLGALCLVPAGDDHRHGGGDQESASEGHEDTAAPAPSEGGHRTLARRRRDRRVLGEDLALELLELGAGLEPELFFESSARVLVALERLGLAARAIKREHQLPAQPLAGRMLGDQGLELGDERGMATERQIGLDAVLERHQPLLLEPGDLVLREGLVSEVGQRRPAPQVQRLGQGLRGAGRLAAVERRSPLGRHALEPVGVHLIGVGLEHIAPAAADEHALAERLAQPRDVDLHRLRRGVGRLLAPELVGDPVDRDDLAPMKQQDRQDRPLPGSAERGLPPVDQDLERAKNPEFHQRTRRDRRR